MIVYTEYSSEDESETQCCCRSPDETTQSEQVFQRGTRTLQKIVDHDDGALLSTALRMKNICVALGKLQFNYSS